MKRTFALALATALAATPAFANDGATGQTRAETCAGLHKYAHAVMEGRQAGVPMPAAMSVADEIPLFEEIVIQAYKTPRWRTEERMIAASDDYANEWYLICLEEFHQ